MLTPTERAEIDALRTWMETIASYPEPGYRLESPDYEVEYRADYCRKHGDRAARLLQRLRRRTHPGQVVLATPSRAGDEYTQHCLTCGIPVDTGGITTPAAFMAEIVCYGHAKLRDAPYLLHVHGALRDDNDRRQWLTIAREVKANV